MNKLVENLIEEVRKLSPRERDELLLRLHLDLEGEAGEGSSVDIDAAWADEVRDRIGKAERGETVAAPHDEVMAELREIARRS